MGVLDGGIGKGDPESGRRRRSGSIEVPSKGGPPRPESWTLSGVGPGRGTLTSPGPSSLPRPPRAGSIERRG